MSVTVRIGSKPGTSFRLRVIGGELERLGKTAAVIDGRVSSFERLVVLSGGAGDYRCFVLEPAEEQGQLELDGFFVRGGFVVVQKENNARRAKELWDAHRPVGG